MPSFLYWCIHTYSGGTQKKKKKKKTPAKPSKPDRCDSYAHAMDQINEVLRGNISDDDDGDLIVTEAVFEILDNCELLPPVAVHDGNLDAENVESEIVLDAEGETREGDSITIDPDEHLPTTTVYVDAGHPRPSLQQSDLFVNICAEFGVSSSPQ
jgi:hypothetical protein